MNDPIGKRRWAIAEGYIPGTSHGPAPQMTSRDLLHPQRGRTGRPGTRDRLLRRPRPGRTLPPQRPGPPHPPRALQRTDRPGADTDYASLIEADVPIVVQHTRLDSRQAELALLSTVAYGAD